MCCLLTPLSCLTLQSVYEIEFLLMTFNYLVDIETDFFDIGPVRVGKFFTFNKSNYHGKTFNLHLY